MRILNQILINIIKKLNKTILNKAQSCSQLNLIILKQEINLACPLNIISNNKKMKVKLIRHHKEKQ